MAESTDYKRLKEDFVSNLTGGTIQEINLVTAVAPASYIFFAALQSRLQLFTIYGPLQLAIDFLLSCGAILLSITLYSAQPILLNILLITPAILIYITNPRPPNTTSKPVRKPVKQNAPETSNITQPQSPEVLPRKPFLTVYRGSMLVVTCAAILAVDFRVFPRRFAKVENWGTSLMDIGVGSFVFSAGLVSARSILKQPSATVSFSSRMKTALRSSIPLLVLGLIRLALVKGVDYAEHVTEYGVHWNFFFTLGFLPPFVATLQSIPVGKNTNPTYIYTALSLIIVGIYQAVLLSTPLQEYVLIGDRHKYGLLGMNKEGASSFFGYLAIFLSGTAAGTYVLPRNKNSLLWPLAAWSAFWCILFMIASEPWGLSIGVSRRLANLSYVLWIAAFNTAQMTAFYLVEALFFSPAATAGKPDEAYNKSVPKILEAYNRNGLAVFLVANVLTGLVNLSIDTLGAGRVEAMVILGAYMGIITIVAVALQSRGIVIKL